MRGAFGTSPLPSASLPRGVDSLLRFRHATWQPRQWKSALVPGRDHLIVWGQSGGTGKLDANGGRWEAGIQLNGNGALTVKGGVVDAAGGENGAGIGRGGTVAAANGTVAVNGGAVIAQGGIRSAGIGGSQGGAAGTVAINGGSVNAIGGEGGAGIGSSPSPSGGVGISILI